MSSLLLAVPFAVVVSLRVAAPSEHPMAQGETCKSSLMEECHEKLAVHATPTTEEVSSLLQSRTHSAGEAVETAAGREEKASSSSPCTIEQQWIWINNKRFSRKNAQDALLGRYGAVEGAEIPAKINFQDDPPSAWTDDNVVFGTKVEISSDQAASLGVNIESAAIHASANATTSHSASYTLQEMRFNSQQVLCKWINDPANAGTVGWMQTMGLNGVSVRIVTTAWLLVAGDPEHSDVCGGAAVTVNVKGTKADVSGKGCGKNTFSFSADSVMAYEASWVKWDPAPKCGGFHGDYFTR